MESESPSPELVDEKAEAKAEIVAEETSPLQSLATLSLTDLDSQRAGTSSLASSSSSTHAEATRNEGGNGSENSATNSEKSKNSSPEHSSLVKVENALKKDEGYFDGNQRNGNETEKVPGPKCRTPSNSRNASRSTKATQVNSKTSRTPDNVSLKNYKPKIHSSAATRKRTHAVRNNFSIPASVISKIRQYWQVDKRQPQKGLEEFLQLERCRSTFDEDYVSHIYHSADEMLRRESLRTVNVIKRSPQLDRMLSEQALADPDPDSSTHRLSEFRRKLPAFALRAELLDRMKNSKVILVKGETGSGKTTQIPQYILEEASSRGEGSSCRILCTQPRRLSAISLANRVAKERGERVGKSVGYKVRLDAVKPRKQGGSIMFCTTGMVLAFMQSDPLLREFSHLVLDEIHDRDVTTDLLVAIIRMVLPFRKDLRVVLMSATLTAETFSAYFDGCPIVQISGVTFPVREYYLEDVLKKLKFYNFDQTKMPLQTGITYQEMIAPYIREIRNAYPLEVINALRRPESEWKQHSLLLELLRHISCSQPEGAILVFLPSVEQITKIHQMIQKHPLLCEIELVVRVLYSKLTGEEQRLVFVKPPPGTRKIILATNIAETSITIDDVVYVVNTGHHMVSVMTGNGVGLEDQWISKSNEVQRKGRAGRVQEGVCYHLYSRARMRTFQENVPPEILRIPLDEVILQIKALRLGEARSFFNRLMDKPSDEVIEASLKLLNRLNAIDDDQHLTLLGSHLAQLRMHPTLGKMVLLASIFGCVDPITSIAASISFKDAFCKPTNTTLEENEIRNRKWFADYSASDHIMLANVIAKWRRHQNRWWFCKRNGLNSVTLEQLCKDKDHVVHQLYQRRFVAAQDCQDPINNGNATNIDLLKGIIAAGLFSNVARLTQSRGFVYDWCVKRRPVQMHHTSVNAKPDKTKPMLEQSRYMVFQNLLNLKNNTTICTTTAVSPLALAFFGDKIHAELISDKMEITIGDQFCFKCDLETYRLIEDLRQGFNDLLTRKLTMPSPIDWSSKDGALLRAIVELLSYNFETTDTNSKAKKIRMN